MLTQSLPFHLQQLFKLPKIERQHLSHTTPDDQDKMQDFIMDNLETLTGNELEAFQHKVSAIVDTEILGDFNRQKIERFINQHLQQYKTMPSKALIAKTTKLNRSTVHRHMQASENGLISRQHQQTFIHAKGGVIGNIISAALGGDLKAAKIFLDAEAKINQPNEQVITNQNNVLVINRTIVNQEAIRQLKPEYQEQIEEILIKALPQTNNVETDQ
jgi:hypothetical protein